MRLRDATTTGETLATNIEYMHWMSTLRQMALAANHIRKPCLSAFHNHYQPKTPWHTWAQQEVVLVAVQVQQRLMQAPRMHSHRQRVEKCKDPAVAQSCLVTWRRTSLLLPVAPPLAPTVWMTRVQ